MADPITIGTTGAISSLCGGVLAIFGIKKQIAKDIKECLKPEIKKLDDRVKRLEGIDVLTVPAHDRLCDHSHALIEAELKNLRERIDSNQLLIIEKIDNLTEKILLYSERTEK